MHETVGEAEVSTVTQHESQQPVQAAVQIACKPMLKQRMQAQLINAAIATARATIRILNTACHTLLAEMSRFTYEHKLPANVPMALHVAHTYVFVAKCESVAASVCVSMPEWL